MNDMPTPSSSGSTPSTWEREVLEKLVLATVEERRRARRWSIFFKLSALTLATILLLVGSGLWGPAERKAAGGMHTALVDIAGVLDTDGDLTADGIGESLRAAFGDANTKGVILRINSPGGSPVQAGIIHDEILRLRAIHPQIPVHAVVEEVCASGGYYVAAAANQIHVDKASIVGSIGVLMEGFGLSEAIGRVGVERRLITAGKNKGYLDMFTPMPPEHRAHAQQMLNEIHRQFIEVVRQGRGDRLREKENPDLFSGFAWTGEKSVELGLADALGSVHGVARDVIKAESIIDFTRHQNLAERLAKRVGASAGAVIARGFSVSGEVPRLR